MTASAVLRVGCHAPVPLHGAPVVAPGCKPGEMGIILGYTAMHEPVTVVFGSLEWDDDLLEAAADAGAQGFMRAGMRRLPAVTA